MKLPLKWPRHVELSLEHNPHVGYHEPLARYLEDGEERFNWVSPEERAKALATNEIWILQWYPYTSVGFCALAASDLEVLLAACAEHEPPGDLG